MITRRSLALGAAGLIVLGSKPALGQPASLHPDLESLRRLIGTWRGSGEGEPGVSAVERSYEPTLGGRFIVCRNRSTYAPQPMNPKGEVHEDIGYLSFDRARRKLVLRQFHVEGFVNQYVAAATPGPDMLVFESEAIENIPAGWRARESYRFNGADSFEEVFELAEAGKAFAVYSQTRLRRVRS